MGFQFAIDRGGTFTDVWVRCPSGQVKVVKLLSEDPDNYSDAPYEAIRRLLEQELNISLPKNEPIATDCIDWIRMGTTVATNALLERKGERCALLINQGFRDLLFIGNQSRPNIFDLKINMPQVLYDAVIEVEERVLLVKDDCQMNLTVPVREGITGEKVHVWVPLNEAKLTADLEQVYRSGIRSLAVVLAHAYLFPDHELRIGTIAKSVGFSQISLSHEVMPMIKIVPRGLTVTADAYLTPCIKRYVNGFSKGFINGLEKMRVLFMQSDGGLTPVDNFLGSRAILSGPAGGVIGYAMTTYNMETKQPVVGFDMGGTSTDVSRYGGSLEHVFESTTAGVSIQAPQLDINTVAAGGGSRLFFRSGMFVVGPESAGAHPGPVCYRKGGWLTVTDANLVLRRLLPEFFPKIFGPTEQEALDEVAARREMEALAAEVNQFNAQQTTEKLDMTVEEIAMGFIDVANETMCRPIRALTQAKGYDTSRHILACFGGAGGQHACAVARILGMKTLFVHKYAGILSAFGLALADVVHEAQEPCHQSYCSDSISYIDRRIAALMKQATDDLRQQGFDESSIQLEPFLHLRYSGSDCALMCACDTALYPATGQSSRFGDFERVFVDRYRSEFGFVLEGRAVLVDDIRVRGSGLSRINIDTRLRQATEPPIPKTVTRTYFDKKYLDTSVFDLQDLLTGHTIPGPAIIIDANSTIVIEPNCTANITAAGDIRIDVGSSQLKMVCTELDTVQLSIFSHRFMSIAEQMGRILQRTAISTNIKERLDFSCALFGPDGGLVANAPHIPVHLGAMQETVQYQMRATGNKFDVGDVLLSNHPTTGGSHLPDLTVITPVFFENMPNPVFFLANRGHHADIGGTTPGSMPPHSHSIYEEGAIFKTFYLVRGGVFQEEALIAALNAPAQYPGCTGTRNLSDNLSDLKAQVAANQKGMNLLLELIREYSLDVVQAYMGHIQANAEIAVRQMLRDIGQRQLAAVGSSYLSSIDYMDDGSPINLTVTIDVDKGSALFDFTGTGPEVIGNTNTPRAVVQSCLIYCLRSMVGYDVPLNQGCLKPIELIIPKDSLLSPSEDAAVVGGNVLTSQRLVDVILHAFEACAASQGCMNNVTFGNSTVGYYETVAGGAGAGPGWHGQSGVHSHMTNTRITDLEILERRYPVILRQFHLRPESGGRGRYRGGDGVIREMMFRQPLTLSLLTERRVHRPYGLQGGEPGLAGRNLLIRQRANVTRTINLGGKVTVTAEPGDIFRLETPGGGGYGAESEKDNGHRPDQTGNVSTTFAVKGSLHDYHLMQYSA